MTRQASAASDTATTNLHGTALAVGERAVLLRGPSGAGKSDLALRCIVMPPGPLFAGQPMLIADDQVVAVANGRDVQVSAPVALHGLIEVRGIGVQRVPCQPSAILALVADLVGPATIDRLPEALEPAIICGREVSRIMITPFEASAPVKLMLALHATWDWQPILSSL